MSVEEATTGSAVSGPRVPVFVVALAVALVVIGAVLAYVGYRRSGGPEGAVRSYYAALAAADAPRALAWGATPAGSRVLLTSPVLAEQQRLAPMRDLQVGRATRRGDRARVPVTYRLAFAAGEVPVHQTLTVLDRDGDWRLAATAVPVRFEISTAAARARVLDGPVPRTAVLAFPGAAPISFDSPYLALAGTDAQIAFAGLDVVEADARLTDAGRTAVTAVVRSALARCLRSGGDVTCPLPGTRYVPGSLHGTATLGSVTASVTGSAGTVDVTAAATFRGSYQVLTFANRVRAGRGTLSLQVHASVPAGASSRVRWVTS